MIFIYKQSNGKWSWGLLWLDGTTYDSTEYATGAEARQAGQMMYNRTHGFSRPHHFNCRSSFARGL